jgi:hypothetical protein
MQHSCDEVAIVGTRSSIVAVVMVLLEKRPRFHIDSSESVVVLGNDAPLVEMRNQTQMLIYICRLMSIRRQARKDDWMLYNTWVYQQ